MEGNNITDEEIDLLLHELFRAYGYDFTNYAKASLRRRVVRLMIIDRFPSFAELYYRVKHDHTYLQRIVEQLTVNVTEMFRDPQLFATLREKVLPVLATHPIIRVWSAGCSTGEEAYSIAVLLDELGLLHKSVIYATDINPTIIENIKKGIFPMSRMKQYSENYIAAGGKKDFSQYYIANYDLAKFNDKLKEKIIPATHNLVTDRSFNEFQLVLCRNVLIYFDKVLQDKVLTLFDASIEKLGFLVLGSKENIRFTDIVGKYKQVDGKEKIWRKIA